MSTAGKPGLLDNVYVILVRPQDPRNIGFVCRAMKTMGITRLRIISAFPVNIRRSGVTAVHAKDILARAEVFPALTEALGDISLAAGITRRRGKLRKYHSLIPEEFARKALQIKEGKVALVFGTEEYGLTDDELSFCHCAVNIPSSPLFPSLNLSHAVQILSYELYKTALGAELPRFRPISNASLAEVVSGVISHLQPLHYFKLAEARSLSVFLTDIFARAALSGSEAKRILSMFHKINGLFIRQKKKLFRPD